jgi:hypothetical protein
MGSYHFHSIYKKKNSGKISRHKISNFAQTYEESEREKGRKRDRKEKEK